VVTIALWMVVTSVFAQVGPPMAFELPMLDGSQFVRLADFTGRPVLLNFWGSDCPPCVKEMPLLVSEARRHSAVQFLGIAVDDRASAIRFQSRVPAGYPQLIAPKAPEVLMRRFGNTSGALPYTVILNGRQQICATHLGEVDAPWVDAAIMFCSAGV
jgi:thiol-disulfide isomerase/thioredoxin